MSNLITYEKDGEVKIRQIKLTDVKLSYPFLISPRPKGMGEGTYSTEFLIYDDTTVELIQEYLNSIIQEQLPGWGNKIPKNLTVPFREPDEEENKYEAGAKLVLKAKTWTNKETGESEQPELFIRDEGEVYPRELTEDEVANYAITAGNIVDAFVTIHPYTFQGKHGITAKVTAVCKTGEGTPVETRPKIDLVKEFSNMNAKPKTGFEKESMHKEEKSVNDEQQSFDLSSLVKGGKKEEEHKDVEKSPEKQGVDISKLLNSQTQKKENSSPNIPKSLQDLMKS